MVQKRDLERVELTKLLELWKAGSLNEREVHERAEFLLDEIGELPNYSESDPRSVAAEVLMQLEILNHQLITREDIPAMEAFLRAQPGHEAEAWAKWRSYWEQLNIESRRQKLGNNPYYCT